MKIKFRLASRLIAHSILLSAIPVTIISSYALYMSDMEITAAGEGELTLEREEKLVELTDMFELAKKQVITLAERNVVVDSMKEFRAAFDDIEASVGKRYDNDLAANEDLLKAVYTYHQANTPNAPANALSKWWPKDRIARILQHYYIAANPYPFGEKYKLDFAADGSRYSQVHRVLHPDMRSFAIRFNYHNISLIDTEGRVVYNMRKEVGFGTNLLNGPYSDSSIAKLFKTAIKAEDANATFFTDLVAYSPSYNAPSMFIGAPIFEGETKLGVLVIQLNVEHLNQLTTFGKRWREIGLGATGETFLVGSDFLLRSEARELIEDLPAFLEHLKANNVAEDIRQDVAKYKSAVLTLKYQAPVVEAALSGKSGVMRLVDHDGDPAVFAYAPFSFGDVKWALLVMEEEQEMFATSTKMREVMLIIASTLALIAGLIGWLFTRTISNPISATVNTLSASASQMSTATAEQERIANQQAASVNETNTTMEELGISSKQSATQAQLAADSTNNVLKQAEMGAQQVQAMLQGMEELRERVEVVAQQILKLSDQTGQIGSITNMMTDFANETKMLAMNAAVEAVRAGEHGRGFSVLSVEIRKLAEESRRSAERINALVADVQKATNATVMATEEGTKTVEGTIDLAHTTAATFGSVSEAMRTVAMNTQQISLNIQQQAEAVRQVVVAMGELKTGAREGAAGIGQIKVGIQTLNDAAKKLQAMT